MKYYSTNKQAPEATLEEAVVKGLAADKGLFMPRTIKPLPKEFYDNIERHSERKAREMGYDGATDEYMMETYTYNSENHY